MVTAEIIDRFAKTARPIIRQYFRADSCVASTRITIEVLSRFGIKARPFQVSPVAMNRQYAALLKAHGGWPSVEVFEEWKEQDPTIWSLGIDPVESNDKRYAGHLVARTGRYIIDASADQLTRVPRGIIVPGVIVLEHNERFFRGEQNLIKNLELGGVVLYSIPAVENNTYLDAPDWRKTEHIRPVIKEIIEALNVRQRKSS